MAENPTKRPSRKRVTNSKTEDIPMTKKRVALGDITNISSNVSGLTLKSSPRKTRTSKSKAVSKNSSSEKDAEETFRLRSDEPKTIGCTPLIYQYLHSLEVEAQRRPLSGYMEKVQKDVSQGMREVLVDWLVEVAEEYKLVSDTLYLTTNYIDRYLSCINLNRNKLQLLGVSCMLVAAKYEEISPPHVEDFCYITDNTYTKDEILLMEREVLKLLDFNVGNPTTKTFLRIFISAAQEKPLFSGLKLDFLCGYIAELSLLDYGCARYIPSMIAASSIFLSRLVIEPNFRPWSVSLQQHTGYKPSELKECVLRLHKLLLKSETAVKRKYMDNKFECVADMNPPKGVSAHFFRDFENHL